MSFDLTVQEIKNIGRRGKIFASVLPGYAAWIFDWNDQQYMAIIYEDANDKLEYVLSLPDMKLIYTYQLIVLKGGKQD